jgi:polyhydroxybutyrate depolymerase
MMRAMRHLPLASILIGVLLFSTTARADPATTAAPTSQPTTRRWTVDGVERVATIYAPAPAPTSAPATRPARVPLVFAFHGHGGTSAGYASKIRLHDAWPEALVVYPQGLPTPGRLTDRAGKFPGWQSAAGDQHDRDLKFFDAMLDSLTKDFPVDDARVYVTGHSNGGTFTYVLWQTRSKRIAAFAPASTALSMLKDNPDGAAYADDVAWNGSTFARPARRPILHIAGRNDPLVKFAWQERTVERLRRLNHTAAAGEPWPQAPALTLYPAAKDAGAAAAAVIAWFHTGKHALPPRAGEVIVRFFKQFPMPAPPPPSPAK